MTAPDSYLARFPKAHRNSADRAYEDGYTDGIGDQSEGSPLHAHDVADALRTAPLGNATRELTARHLAKKLGQSEDFVERAMGWAPTIGNVGV